MKASEIIEELQRGVDEFGDGPGLIVDEMEPSWAYPITSVDHDPERQAFTVSADR